ncbi:MAG: sulfite exporter TauE/SafE family protein [Verrucomicrobiales bacterium]|nr:sulfite exporter TauE/SafE family protein [Verrucomicrobiales bacterium]
MYLGTALLLGLVGGLHCAGMCGPLMLAMPVAGNTRGRFVAGRLAYQAGRIAVYAVLGALVGSVGRTLALAGVQRWVSLLLGILLLATLVLSPRALALPAITLGVARLRSTMAGFLQRRTVASLAVLGGLNGLLPCGLVYAACAAAAATGDIATGAATMAVFGLGTTPMMLGISLTGRLVPADIRIRLRHLAPVTMGLMGTLLVLRGLSLGIPFLSPDLADPAHCHPSSAGSTAAHVAPTAGTSR